MALEITVSEMKRVQLFEVSGRVDSMSANELGEALNSVIIDGHSEIVIDMQGIEYMSSAGLREIVSALKRVHKNNGDIRLANPSERVTEVLELAGLDTIFKIYPTQVEAVGSF
ncbi:MAG: STAS domain-containing protein [Anaerolineae bacterium]|nr:STAS domain-containing protein [Anaerolineae bacterium]